MTGFVAIVASNAVIAALLALVTVIVTRFWRSPQLAHGLWLLVLLKLVTPPLVTVSPPSEWLARITPSDTTLPPAPPDEFIGVEKAEVVADASAEPYGAIVSLPEPSLEPVESIEAVEVAHAEAPTDHAIATAAPTGPSKVVAERDLKAGAWNAGAAYGLVAVWIAGSLGYLSLLAWRCVSFRRLVAHSTPAPQEILESATRLALKLGLRRRYGICAVDAAVPPLVWSLGLRPLIVLPSKLLAGLSASQCEALVAHELAHVRRRDDLVRWLEVFALVLWWWHPVAWFARRKLREAEEECCDAWVVWALPGERRSYGEAMLATIDFLTDGPKLPALAESAFGTSFCKRRIEMIMKRNVSRKISWAALGMIVLLAGTALPIVAQTSETNDGEGSAVAEDAAAAADTGVAAEGEAVKDSAVAEDANAGSSGDAAVKDAASDDAVDGAGDSSLDSAATSVDSSSEAAGLGTRSRWRRGIAATTRKDDLGDDAFESRDALLQRIKRLEELHLAEESLGTGRRATGGGSSSTAAVWPRLPNFEVSPNEREQKLQEQLLKLDVVAAQSEIEQARIVYEKSVEINKTRPGTVADIDIRREQSALRAKEIQLQRAEIVLELFKQQAQRKREESSRFRRYQQGTTRQQTPGEAEPDARTRAAMDAKVKALRRDELARLRAQHKHVAEELERLENLLKEAPQSPETWERVDRFLKIYRNLAAPEGREPPPRERESVPHGPPRG